MKICIDATPLGAHTNDRGGVYRYIWKLVESLSVIDKENRYTLLFNFFRNRHVRSFRETVQRLSVGENFSVKLSRYPVRLQRYIDPPAELLAGFFDVMHGCFDHLRPVLFGKGIVTIHDIRYLEDVEYEEDTGWVDILRQTTPSPDIYIHDYLSRKNLFHHLRANIMKTVQRASRIITVSEYSRSRIIERLNVKPEKVNVIYHGVDDHISCPDETGVKHILDKLGISKPYILYVGKFEPQKNIIRLIEAFKLIAQQKDIVLVMAGPSNWYYYIVLEKASQLNIRDSIIFTDYVTDNKIAALYRGASVFVFPSLYEGFGLPLLEAMACRLPIVSSNLCSIPEVVGSAALFANPYSPSDIAEKVICLLDNESLRNKLIRAGVDRAGAFSWKKTAENTLKIYTSVYS